MFFFPRSPGKAATLKGPQTNKWFYYLKIWKAKHLQKRENARVRKGTLSQTLEVQKQELPKVRKKETLSRFILYSCTVEVDEKPDADYGTDEYLCIIPEDTDKKKKKKTRKTCMTSARCHDLGHCRDQQLGLRHVCADTSITLGDAGKVSA